MIYGSILPQIKALTDGEPNMIANLSNISAVIKEAFGFLWVGFYLVDGDELVLGPFQGPIACTRIAKGKGVCGKAWAEGSTIVVQDVEEFEDHIACSTRSRSEIVVPVRNSAGEVTMVLDIDSEQLADFSETDVHHLEQLAQLITTLI